jgi:hypothetical protein
MANLTTPTAKAILLKPAVVPHSGYEAVLIARPDGGLLAGLGWEASQEKHKADPVEEPANLVFCAIQASGFV